MKVIKIILFIFLLALTASISSAVVINEFVVDPQSDWDKNGNVSSSRDEWIELYNPSNQTIDLTNWTIIMNDSSSTEQLLSGSIGYLGYKTLLDPAGTMNNDGQLLLYDNFNNLVDSVTYGTWNDNNESDNAPTGNANSFSDECLARIPNAQDTDVDSDDFLKVECTYNSENKIILPNEQNVEVTIGGKIVFKVLPRNLEFGIVQPGSTNNSATNGPIIFNINGSTTDARVEITEVKGFPFNQGLKIDNAFALSKFWNILLTSPIVTVVPTLDVPKNASVGNQKGTIVYTVTGIPS